MVPEILSLARRSFHYFLGHALLMIAGLVSFPILTRIMTVEQYGMVGIISVTIFILQSVARVGAPSAIVRFYGSFRLRRDLPAFFSTVITTYGAFAVVLTALMLAFVQLAPRGLFEPETRSVLSIVALLVLVSSLLSLVISTLRAEQKSGLYNCILIAQRYLGLAAGIFLFIKLGLGLSGFYLGQAVAVITLCALILPLFVRGKGIKRTAFSWPFFKELLKYGSPLTTSEISHLMLSYSDRYFIKYFLGAGALGLYTAAYNLTTYVTDLLMYPVNNAIDPIYLDIYARKGKDEAGIFISKAATYFLLVAFPAVFGFIAIGGDLISLLAPDTYSQAHIVIPYVIAGNSIYACQIFLNSGLVIAKKTHILMTVKLISCLLNIGINLFMIPKFGILGAAQSTFISYALYTVAITYFSFKELKLRFDYPHILLYFLLSLSMYLTVTRIGLESPLTSLGAKILCGTAFYSLGVIILDRRLRGHCVELVRRTWTSRKESTSTSTP